MFTSGVNTAGQVVNPAISEAADTARFNRLFERVALQQGLSFYQAPSREYVIKLAAMLSAQMSRTSYFSGSSQGEAGVLRESTLSMLKARSQFSSAVMRTEHDQQKTTMIIQKPSAVMRTEHDQVASVAVRESAPRRFDAGEAGYSPVIHEVAEKYGLDPALIHSVIAVESDFQADAVSPVGAQGLMQLMPATAAELGVTDPFDAKQNIEAGSRYLSRLLERYHGDLPLALAAYNWGMGNVERHPQRMPEETRQYIVKVMSKMDEMQVA